MIKSITLQCVVIYFLFIRRTINDPSYDAGQVAADKKEARQRQG